MPTRSYVTPPLPYRPPDGHKGTFKRIFVVSGSPDMLGAPLFASTSALLAGAGLVQVGAHKTLLPLILATTPELVGHPLDDRSDRKLLADAEKADLLVIGPGMGLSPISRRRLIALLKLDLPTVLDADALTLLSRERKLPKRTSSLTLTPHPGEMQRLRTQFDRSSKTSPLEVPSSDPARLALATRAAHHYRATVILKGARTVVTDGASYFINPISDSSLAKAGTGDILAGLTGTLTAQLVHPFQAAQLAVHLHASAGVLAGKSQGPRSALARDILHHLPAAIQAHPEAPMPEIPPDSPL